jgi:hypothetical protein
MYGQQSLMPRVSAVTSGFGGGQLIEAALIVLVWDAMAGRVPLRHFGSLHCIGDAATGGTPLTQSGSGHALADAAAGGGPPLHVAEPPQALAACAVKLSEPTVRAAEITAPAASRLT